ncbi:MAG: 6-carboxytetrahydropterin synthase QueD [Dehalococcoidales bacterium]|nr:6-carboxytetrahydropterin synthase QueD [Dehalococcoidales bacterium]
MYEIVVEQHFESAHFLRGYKGKCENLHGHRYLVRIRLQGNKLNDIGLVYDFSDIKRHLKGILSGFDHACLNDIQPFDRINPSAENIAAEIFRQCKIQIAEENVLIAAVEVWENPQQGIIYRPDLA